MPADRRKRPALEPPEAAELTRLGVQIEQLYGMPMDVEWGVAYDGRPSILQGRVRITGSAARAGARRSNGPQAQPEGENTGAPAPSSCCQTRSPPACHTGPPVLERGVLTS